MAGHPGRDETLQKVQQNYWWIGMKKWIEDYVKGCAICQHTKVQTHKWHTPIYQILTTPNTLPFQTIAMNLITGLPNRWGFNTILTIVNHGCSRAVIFLPCTTNISRPGIAQLYLDHIYQWFVLPTKIISNRDPRFTSHFRKAITKKLGIQQNLSTAFHLQTDRLSEWKNQWVEQYLCTITTSHPEDWSYWILVTLAVHNNRINSTTGLSPNQVLFGYTPCLAPSEAIKMDNEAAEKQVKWMIEAQDWAIRSINQKAGKTPSAQFAIGDQVWLEGTHLKLPHQSTKLAPKRYGPFKIRKQVNLVMYQVMLPTTWQIHPVFHASLLSPYSETDAHGPNYSRPPPNLIGEEFYEVEQIWDHRHHGQSRTLQYLIKWKGSPKSDNTWEPADLVIAPDLLREYHKHRLLSGIKANQLSLQYPQHLSWIPQNNLVSSIPSYGPPPLPLTNSMSSNNVPAPTRTSLAPLCTAAIHTSPTSMPLNMHSSARSTTVAIIPEDHLLCQPRICLAANPLPCSHPLHPCPFQCASHSLNKPLTTSQDILASARMIPIWVGKVTKEVARIALATTNSWGFPLSPTSVQNMLAATPNPSPDQFRSIITRLATTIRIRDDVHREKVEGLKADIAVLQQRVDNDNNGLQNAHLGTKRTRSASQTSQSPSTMEQSNSPVSSNNSMMEGLLGSIVEPRARRRHKSLSHMPLPITPLTNQWNHYPPGSAAASGVIKWHTPSSKMPSMTLMTGDSLPMYTDTASTTRSVPTSPRNWSFWRQITRVPSRLTPSSRSTSLQHDSQTGSSILPFAHLWGPFNRHGRKEAWSDRHTSPPTRDEDVSM